MELEAAARFGRQAATSSSVPTDDAWCISRVLYTSGHIDSPIVDHGQLKAGTEFISKPFTPNTLANRVR